MDLGLTASLVEGLFMSAMMQDWQQTSKFLREPPRIETVSKGQNYDIGYSKKKTIEANPLLGKDPSQAKMTGAGIAAAGLQFAGYESINDDAYKLLFAAASLIPEAMAVNNNRQRGYKLDPKAAALGLATTAGIALYDKNKKDKNASISPAIIGNAPGIIFNKKF